MFFKSKVKTNFITIFGHTPTFRIPYKIAGKYPSYYNSDSSTYDRERIIEEARQAKIWHGDNKVGIDCGCYIGGQLGCLRLNNIKEFYLF